MSTAELLSFANLIVLLLGGGVGVGMLMAKVNRLTQQVNGGFEVNHKDHERIYGKIDEAERDLADVRTQTEGRLATLEAKHNSDVKTILTKHLAKLEAKQKDGP